MEAMQLETTVIPFINGLSQEIRRISRTVGVRCVFSTPNLTRRLYSTKDRLPVESATHAVYYLSCKTCKEEYIGETLRAVKVRCKEHRDAEKDMRGNADTKEETTNEQRQGDRDQ